MMVDLVYSCGCKVAVKVSGRSARDRSLVKEASKNNGLVQIESKCKKCDITDLVSFVKTLDREELVMILLEGVKGSCSTRQLLRGVQAKVAS